MPRINRAARLLHGILVELKRMDEIKATQPPIEGRNAGRSLAAERHTWRVSDEKVPQREEMFKKYGWHALSAGLRLQPTHHVETVMRMDRGAISAGWLYDLADHAVASGHFAIRVMTWCATSPPSPRWM